MCENCCKCKQEQPAPVRAVNSVEVLPSVLGDIALSQGVEVPHSLGERLQKILSERAEMGKVKYGTYLTTHNGRDCIRDFCEELYDGLFYIKQADMEGCVSKKEYIAIHSKLLEILSILEG